MSLARAAAGAVALRAPRSTVAGGRKSSSTRRGVVRCTAVHLKFELEGHPEARVVGGHPALGGWNAAGGVKNGDIITINDGQSSTIEYKWVDGDTWEVRENRSLTLPALADPDSSVALAVRDRSPVWTEQVAQRSNNSSEFAGWSPAPTQQYQEPERTTYQEPVREQYTPPAQSFTPSQSADPSAGRYADGRPPRWFTDSIVYAIQTLGFCGCEGPPGQFTEGERLNMLVEDGWLDHMARLGATVLYLGPLMRTSHDLGHGYDTADYFEVDPRLGSVATLRRVVDAAHALGIRVILDGVFNHTGLDHFAARDVRQNGRNSKYWDWYYAQEDGNGGATLKGWEGHVGLPELNHDNPEVRQHLMDCGRFWLSPDGADIDGWRLDVAHEVQPDFWRYFASACKETKNDCALLGELMHGDYNTHVGPGLLDSGTNYQLSKALWSSLNDHNYWELQHSFQRDEDMYGNLTMLNFLGNHDQCRIYSRLTNPQEHYKLAAAVLLLSKGVPCVYYGDEVAELGAPGGPDGDLAMRRPLNLGQALQRPEAVAAVKSTAELMWLRRGHSALRDGDSAQIPLVHSNGQLSFARVHQSNGSVAVVAMNNESQPARVNLPVAQKCGAHDGTVFVEPLAGGQEHHVSNGELVVELPPNGFRVFTKGQ
tara:strand:+ start:311 stop:2269 length:1959 start_codon:yes stop_codon:yes gene_type:complete